MRNIKGIGITRECDECGFLKEREELFEDDKGTYLVCLECYENILDEEYLKKVADGYFHNKYNLYANS